MIRYDSFGPLWIGDIPPESVIKTESGNRIRLFRGDKIHRITQSGIFSKLMLRQMEAGKEEGAAHAHALYIAQGKAAAMKHITGFDKSSSSGSFVSASLYRSIADKFAEGSDEIIVELSVPVERAFQYGDHVLETLIPAQVFPDEIVRRHLPTSRFEAARREIFNAMVLTSI